MPSGLTPEAVRNLNIQDMPVAPRISGKEKQWKRAGIWKGPTDMREIKRGGANV